MCIICIKPKGAAIPSDQVIKTMFAHNPHGAGYMIAKRGRVYIHKGFMDAESFLSAIHAERIRKDQTAVLHFRISTQGGVNPGLTHPFPLSASEDHLTALDLTCNCGIAHNGIIRLTSDSKARLSDTQIFIRDYLTELVTTPDDLQDAPLLAYIEELIQSKMVLLDRSGSYAKIGNFIEDGGCFYSNESYKEQRFTLNNVKRSPAFIRFMEKHGKYLQEEM